MRRIGIFAISALFGLCIQMAHANFENGISSGWTGTGNYGVLAPNGVVTTSPLGNGKYGYVSSHNGVSGVSPFHLGGETDGSTLVSSAFSAQAGDKLEFYFNYITSDGPDFADYGWARLLNADNNSQVALLFTARTKPSGNIIPGQGMPTPDAAIPNAPIIGGGPAWSALGTDSGSCNKVGCGYTNWVHSSYLIATNGNYKLEFGVTDWTDGKYSSGMAFDGITVDGKPIDTSADIPVPAAVWLFGSAMAGLVKVGHRKQAA